jgi:hypothetical protein
LLLVERWKLGRIKPITFYTSQIDSKIMNIDNYQLSLAINSVRSFLLKRSFFEVHLYSTLNYKIENTASFDIKKELFLRFNPEPDIWTVGEKHGKFFWIGSMFRNEDKLSSIHSYEFTVVDIYEVGTKENVKKRFTELLSQLEKDLSLKPLSRKFVEIDHGTPLDTVKDKECWILLNHYPREESFYDTAVGREKTKKFELFYKRGKVIIEIVACGELGENANPRQFIKDTRVVKKTVFKKGFVGFGIGLERLLLLYGGR